MKHALGKGLRSAFVLVMPRSFLFTASLIALYLVILSSSASQAQTNATATTTAATTTAPSSTAATTTSPPTTYTQLVTCHAASKTGNQTQDTCSGGLSLSGDTPSTIFIDGLPIADKETVRIDAASLRREWSQGPPTTAVTITIYTKRWLWKTYGKREAECIGEEVQASPKCPPIAVVGSTPGGINVIVRTANTDATTGHDVWSEYAFQIPVKFNPWATVDFGGFDAYSGAHDDMLVTQDAGGGMSKVLQRRRGDRIGPNAGLVASFRATNYPYLGIEFGTSDVKDHGTSYFFGPSLRLLGEDRALFSVGAGISVAKILRYPQAQVGATYPTDDKRLVGTAMNSHKPYVSISLAVSLGSK